MCGGLVQPHRVCRTCTPPLSHPLSAEPRTMSCHGIVVVFVTKHLLHMHQQVLHGDIFPFIQGAGPFAWVPTETGKDMGANTAQGRRPHQNVRVCTSLPHLDQLT